MPFFHLLFIFVRSLLSVFFLIAGVHGNVFNPEFKIAVFLQVLHALGKQHGILAAGNADDGGIAAGNGGGSKRICCGSGIVLGKLSLRMPKTRVLKASGREKEDGET